MVASPFAQLPEHVMRSEGGASGIVRAAAIYGANGSGKTKFIDGLSTIQRLVTTSFKPRQSLPIEKFALGTSKNSAAVKLEVLYKVSERVFQYGLVADKTSVKEEWLFEISGTREICCFERVTREEKTEIIVGPGFARKGSKEYQKLALISSATGHNQTFLNKAWENQSPKAAIAISWFFDVLQIIGADAEFESLEVAIREDEKFSHFLAQYLKAVGTGIESIKTIEREVDIENLFKTLSDESRQNALKQLDGGATIVVSSPRGSLSKISKTEAGKFVEFQLRAVHSVAEGEPVAFDFKAESHGTQRLVHLLPAVFEASIRQKVFVIDELDRKLHTLLVRQFLTGFLAKTQMVGSQIVFTTHDTNLLDQEVLRRDEIWFVEKCPLSGGAVLYPLTDFEPRHDLKLDRGYLQGRFGAIPFFGDLKALFGK
jgi:AAA15 family ATPase/GTPase